MSIPVEVETTLQRLSSHWSVKGVMILDNTSWRVVQYSGSMLEAAESDGKQQKMESNGIPENSGDDGVAGPTSVENGQPLSSAVSKYAAIVRRIVISSKEGIEAGDDVRELLLCVI